ncbi:hypothetical protein QN277_007210 [Acacia crassicarpa]|uniref:Ionotropic glutamate receptor C-terminal domain-containing protein n=1 Tax=Acacia crassicarpa TaxID=499986 RepID=A0AAE1M8L9_9FABA|nr:hypothetical protein QN277_007210 [Acacia crassicarpa]
MAKFLKCLLFWLLMQLLQLQNSQTVSGESSPNLIMRIGVPKKDGFSQFVQLRWQPRENKYIVSGGYCIDVFNAVIKQLPFKVSPQFTPFVNQTGQSAGTYDSLVQQIPQTYDAVVGDVTIVANRSRFVDFSLPYAETGVSMLVKVQHERHLTMWIFVKPFSWGLWLSIAIVSIFIGFVISIMERNVNNLPERGSQTSTKQLNVVTILWFPLSQAVLPDREVVVKSCSRFVLMVWLLLAFVLMQSYTASLTSILTVDQLQPSFLNVNDLRNGNYYVGYQANSFVRDLLVQRLNLDPSKLRAYSNLSEYHHALAKGSQGGGVAAIFDEIPFLKLYLNKYGSNNYMMAGSTYRTDGFGFAFPFGSNLTSHFSRAILNVTESDIMDRIQKKYFGEDDSGGTGQVSSSSTTTASLTFHSFQGLFLVTGIVTVMALIVSESVIWQKPISMARAYSERYLFRSSSTPPRSRDNSVSSPG